MPRIVTTVKAKHLRRRDRIELFLISGFKVDEVASNMPIEMVAPEHEFKLNVQVSERRWLKPESVSNFLVPLRPTGNLLDKVTVRLFSPVLFSVTMYGVLKASVNNQTQQFNDLYNKEF